MKSKSKVSSTATKKPVDKTIEPNGKNQLEITNEFMMGLVSKSVKLETDDLNTMRNVIGAFDESVELFELTIPKIKTVHGSSFKTYEDAMAYAQSAIHIAKDLPT